MPLLKKSFSYLSWASGLNSNEASYWIYEEFCSFLLGLLLLTLATFFIILIFFFCFKTISSKFYSRLLRLLSRTVTPYVSWGLPCASLGDVVCLRLERTGDSKASRLFSLLVDSLLFCDTFLLDVLSEVRLPPAWFLVLNFNYF